MVLTNDSGRHNGRRYPCGAESNLTEVNDMAIKNTKKVGSTDESNLKGMAGKIMESGQQIWLAGLGAFAKAQEEGSKLYDSLIKEGSALEKITSKYTTAKVSEVRGAVETTVNQVKDRATDTLSKLEKVFEDRVSGALGALGIPGREELSDLSRKVEELNRLVKGLGGKGAVNAAPTKVAAKPAVKAAAKPAVKAAAKPAVKAAAKPAVKAVKAAVKPAVKAVKVAVKAVAKPAVKAATKPASGLQKVQAQAQKIAKSVEAQAKVAVKSASKSAKATLEKASSVAKEAVKTVSDAVSDITK